MRSSKEIILKESGKRVWIGPDRYVDGGMVLEIDDTPQSLVVPEHPEELHFEYVIRMGHLIDLYGEPGKAITALHLGAGALSIPRYIEHTRPGSRQQVIEKYAELVDLVREVLPLPKQASIRFRYGDAREALKNLPAGLRGAIDVIVVDVFDGATTPASVCSIEFYQELAAFMKPGGIVIANIADGPGLRFAKSQVSTLGAVFKSVAAFSDTGLLKGHRYGNVVMVAGNEDLSVEWMPRLLAAGPHPAKMLIGAELSKFAAGAPVMTDLSAVPSSEPKKFFL